MLDSFIELYSIPLFIRIFKSKDIDVKIYHNKNIENLHKLTPEGNTTNNSQQNEKYTIEEILQYVSYDNDGYKDYIFDITEDEFEELVKRKVKFKALSKDKRILLK
ncbi:MAG: hypothetical protein IPG18_17330 [Saprospiraceae bacterium]|nr:hypothetical protein [Saprospiraceae bacterium]